MFGHLDTEVMDADVTAFDIDTEGNLLMGGKLEADSIPYFMFLSETEVTWAKTLSLDQKVRVIKFN